MIWYLEVGCHGILWECGLIGFLKSVHKSLFLDRYYK